MSSTAIRAIRHTALLTVPLLSVAVATVVVAAQPGSSPAPRYLGQHGLELAAFRGDAGLYLRMHPVTPTIAKPNHTSDAPLTSIGWTVDTPAQVGGTGYTASPTLNEFTLHRAMDSFSVPLLAEALHGTGEPSASLYVVRNGTGTGTQSDDEQLRYDLTDVAVSHDAQTSTTTGSSETIDLVYTTVTVSYYRNGTLVSKTTYDASET